MAAVETQMVGDRISKRNFEKLAQFIYDYSGIKMPSTKLTMLEGRLRRRLRATNHATFDGYCDFLFHEDGLEQETVYLIDAVTTNKTDFFREARHFEYMQQVALPALAGNGVRTIRTWSSACSTGAEPYTMAMVLEEFTADRRDLNYSILATDLSTDVLATARRGIYADDMIHPVPRDLQRKYVMVAKKADRREVRISAALRSRVGFARMNLMDESYPVGEAHDLLPKRADLLRQADPICRAEAAVRAASAGRLHVHRPLRIHYRHRSAPEAGFQYRVPAHLGKTAYGQENPGSRHRRFRQRAPDTRSRAAGGS
jgi:chemotaxis protein methyltransferase CheR